MYSPRDSKPPFTSDIPPFLLDGSTPKEIWLYNNISVLSQKTEYLVDEQGKQSLELGKQNKELATIKEQCLKTNGRVSKHDSQLGIIEEITKDLRDIVGTKRFVEKALVSRWFYMFLGIFIVGIVAIAKSEALQGWLLTIFGG